MAYHHAGCQDRMLLWYAIQSLQGYPRVSAGSGMDITLDNVLTILDKHYNNVKALDALNQELFQVQMVPTARHLITKPKTTSFFPLQKLKGNQLAFKMATMNLAHLEEESPKRRGGRQNQGSWWYQQGYRIVYGCLAWAVKDAQVEEKHCYHCSSPEHFICNCLLVRASKENTQLNRKEGMASRKGAQTPQMKMTTPKNPQKEVPKA